MSLVPLDPKTKKILRRVLKQLELIREYEYKLFFSKSPESAEFWVGGIQESLEVIKADLERALQMSLPPDVRRAVKKSINDLEAVLSGIENEEGYDDVAVNRVRKRLERLLLKDTFLRKIGGLRTRESGSEAT